MGDSNNPSRLGLVVGALILGGVVGYFVGKGTPGPQVPPTQTPPAPSPMATTTPTPKTHGGAVCLTPGPQTIVVGENGSPDCPSAFIYDNQTVTWQTTPGATLWIKFPNATVFPQITCRANECNSNPPASGSGSTNGTGYDYNVNVFQTTTPTPRPGSKTPTPQVNYGRVIIIKP
jgi:hypothetical protein